MVKQVLTSWILMSSMVLNNRYAETWLIGLTHHRILSKDSTHCISLAFTVIFNLSSFLCGIKQTLKSRLMKVLTCFMSQHREIKHTVLRTSKRKVCQSSQRIKRRVLPCIGLVVQARTLQATICSRGVLMSMLKTFWDTHLCTLP